jgi:prepilin-type N-terminal cleavage/methylation domain-containing protein
MPAASKTKAWQQRRAWDELSPFETPGGNGREERAARMRGLKTQGFSLLEMMIVLSVFLTASAIATITIQPVLAGSRVNSGYNTTLGVLRQARDNSIGQRQVFIVTFNTGASPNSISITQGLTGNVLHTYQLSPDVLYTTVPGFPTSPVVFPMTPDGFGLGATAVDFDQGIAGGTQNLIYFQPDGSAQDVNGNINNGVVYITRTGDLNDARAITLWGATGRLRGWHLYTNNLGTHYWRQQ